jgi:hypothetical protein
MRIGRIMPTARRPAPQRRFERRQLRTLIRRRSNCEFRAEQGSNLTVRLEFLRRLEDKQQTTIIPFDIERLGRNELPIEFHRRR